MAGAATLNCFVQLLHSSSFSPAWALRLLLVCVRAPSAEWALMSLQRAVALLGTRLGWPGTEGQDEVEAAVVLLSQPTCSLETARPSPAFISRGLQPVCSAFSQPTSALDELAQFEGLTRPWRRFVVMRAMLSTIMSISTACHLSGAESFLLSEHFLCLCSPPYPESPKNPLCWLPLRPQVLLGNLLEK